MYRDTLLQHLLHHVVNLKGQGKRDSTDLLTNGCAIANVDGVLHNVDYTKLRGVKSKQISIL